MNKELYSNSPKTGVTEDQERKQRHRVFLPRKTSNINFILGHGAGCLAHLGTRLTSGQVIDAVVWEPLMVLILFGLQRTDLIVHSLMKRPS